MLLTSSCRKTVAGLTLRGNLFFFFNVVMPFLAVSMASPLLARYLCHKAIVTSRKKRIICLWRGFQQKYSKKALGTFALSLYCRYAKSLFIPFLSVVMTIVLSCCVLPLLSIIHQY